MKKRSRSTYLLSKNPRIRFWYQQLGHLSNARVVEAFKLTDRIDITIEKSQQIQEEPFSSNFKVDNEDKNSKSSLASNTSLAPATTLLNKVISTSINPNYSIELLCDPYIKSKNIKIVKYKKMTPTTCKLKEIYTNL